MKKHKFKINKIKFAVYRGIQKVKPMTDNF